jgi:hypothetical protein
MKAGLIIAAGLAVASPSLAHDGAAASSSTQAIPAQSKQLGAGTDRKLLSLDQAKAQQHGRLSRIVLEFLTVMDRIVNKDKQPAITTADWAPLGQLIDQKQFRRVGNFGVKNDWASYSQLLTQWANSSWWKGYIWRMREVPGSAGQPGLVYLETEERSNQKHPVREDGDYRTLDSIAVYEIDANGKIVGLHVYDQRPL